MGNLVAGNGVGAEGGAGVGVEGAIGIPVAEILGRSGPVVVGSQATRSNRNMRKPAAEGFFPTEVLIPSTMANRLRVVSAAISNGQIPR